MLQYRMQRKHYEKKVEIGDASKLKVGIIISRFNEDITEGLLEGALETLALWRVSKANITILRVPGSFEIPFAAQRLIARAKPHAVIALGCIIKGETSHDYHIASAVSHGITRVALDTKTPISFGILTTNTLAQAQKRSKGKANAGIEAAIGALESALLPF